MKVEGHEIPFREERIDGYLYLPEKEEQSPLIIALNGMPGLDPIKEKDRLAPIFTKSKFAYFAFDYTGVRKSSGLYEYYYSHENINKIISYLSKHPKIDSSRIGLFGESFGGAMALSHATRDKRIRCLAIRSPVYDTEKIPRLKIFEGLAQLWQRDKQMRIRYVNLKKEFQQQSKLYNPMKLAPLLQVPIRVITGDKDEILSEKQIQKFFDKIPSNLDKKFMIVEGANHNFSKPKDFEIMKDFILDFFIETL
ncbi:MAG: prolyl oligopeptidase family serine peptidase [Candidatus Heimdallarchaeota archaeon]|nr:prolyl oligopeptidase family serine peptidase [Candidatus Heimdallarchaeota archaeon]MCK4954798.1 prolyl oligopeptidase family serine peptidase [Candidatus Heimdallarchaeota archaeon]